MKPYSYKRIIAYIIDIMIVTFISTMLTYFLPENKAYNESIDEYGTLVNDFTNNSIEQTEFVNRTNNLIYSINRNSVTVSIVTTVITISYFVVFAYFMNGQTLGKKLMKIIIVSNDRKKLTMNNYLIRGMLINSILMDVLGIIFILGLKKDTYLKVNDILTYIFGIFTIVTFGMILFREDKRGLHDYLAGTKVVNVKDYIENEFEEEQEKITKEDKKIKDAYVIGEKKEM